jgi:hypothetical protein
MDKGERCYSFILSRTSHIGPFFRGGIRLRRSLIAPRSVRFGMRLRKLSNIGRSLDGWPKIYYLELLHASEGTLSRWPRLHLQLLVPTKPHWARVMGYGTVSLCVIHKEGLCSSSGDIYRLMMMMICLRTVPPVARRRACGNRPVPKHSDTRLTHYGLPSSHLVIRITLRVISLKSFVFGVNNVQCKSPTPTKLCRHFKK